MDSQIKEILPIKSLISMFNARIIIYGGYLNVQFICEAGKNRVIISEGSQIIINKIGLKVSGIRNMIEKFLRNQQ